MATISEKARTAAHNGSHFPAYFRVFVLAIVVQMELALLSNSRKDAHKHFNYYGYVSQIDRRVRQDVVRKSGGLVN